MTPVTTSPHSNIRNDINDRVLLDQVRAAVGNPGQKLSSTVAANLVAAALLVFAMYDRMPSHWLAGWLVLMALFQLTRARMSQAYWVKAPTDGPALQSWLTKLNGLSVASGLLWGCTGWMFFSPDSVIHQALLAVLLCAMAAGSVPRSTDPDSRCTRPVEPATVPSIRPCTGRQRWPPHP